MKICPVCKQTYNDDNLNFCLNDGGTLERIGDDAPPTVFMNQARTTQQNWSEYETNNQWQNQPLANNQNFGVQNQNFAVQGQNQTLATVSLILGILSIVLICCWGGIPLGTGALVTGYLAYNNINREPHIYSGQGMAIAGIVTGGIGIVLAFFMIISAIFSNR